MGQILHGCATTTHAVRKAIQRSKASLTQLSRTYGINPKTVQKWRKRENRRRSQDRAETSALDASGRG